MARTADTDDRVTSLFAHGGPLFLAWAFVERQTNMWKRHWGWEIVWLVYGVVNTLAVTFIAKQIGESGVVTRDEASRLILFLFIGTLVWSYLSAELDDISLVVVWERWEGTIEHTLMAPVSRITHLIGMSMFGVMHALARTVIIAALALPFFDVDLDQADWLAALTVLVVGSFSVVGLGIFTGILPLTYPERGEQMSFMMQVVVLLLSGVYYTIDTLPGWMAAISRLMPPTYMLRSMRAAIIDGKGIGDLKGDLGILLVFGVAMIPLSMWAFSRAEMWAKRTGRLKRHG